MAEELYPARLTAAWRDPADRASLLLVQHGRCIAEASAIPPVVLSADGRNTALLGNSGAYRFTVSQAPCRLLRLVLPKGFRRQSCGGWHVELGLLLPMLRLFEQALHHPGGAERRAELGATLLGYVFHQLRQAGCELDQEDLIQSALASGDPLDDDLLRQLQRWLSSHLSDALQVQDLARAIALSPRRLQEICRAQAGCTPMELLRGMRLDALAEQLHNPLQRNQPIATLMRQLGLADSAATRRDFHLRFGRSPAEYRLSLLAHQ